MANYKSDLSQANLVECLTTCQKMDLDGLVFIGGGVSCQKVARIAEYFAEKGSKTKVVASVQHIEGGNSIDCLPISIGFDTVSRVYAQFVGDLCSYVMST